LATIMVLALPPRESCRQGPQQSGLQAKITHVQVWVPVG
jgi:hypothetical protein